MTSHLRLAASVDSHFERQQAAEDDAALARDERNEAIAEGVTFDTLDFSVEQIAVLDAALRRAQLEDVYEVWGILKMQLDAGIAKAIKTADLAPLRLVHPDD